MPEREPYDSESAAQSGAPATPRASGELAVGPDSSGPQASVAPLPESSMRAFELRSVAPPVDAPTSEPSDTLLSAGKPADKLEIMLEDRLALVDERMRELSGRLAILEQKKSVGPVDSRQKPWLWIAFLIGLVVVFQLLHRVR